MTETQKYEGFTDEERDAMKERARELKDGKIVCFFRNSQKFKTRYATLGFNDAANLDDGTMWPTADDEARIAKLVAQAAS